MKLNPFHQQTSQTDTTAPKPPSAAPMYRPAEPPPRAWSLLLPPSFRRDGQ